MAGTKRKRAKATPWRGEAVHRAGGCTYYEAAQLDGDTQVAIGDCVRVLVKGEQEALTWEFAVIEAMWRDTRLRSEHAEVRWFARPSDTPLAAKAVEGELFETDDVGEIEFSAISDKVEVLAGEQAVSALRRLKRRSRRGLGDGRGSDEASDSSDAGENESESDGEEVDNATDSRRKRFYCGYFYERELKSLRPCLGIRGRYLKSKRLAEKGDHVEEACADQHGFSKALRLLQLSAVPADLPCRESEREQILTFIRESLVREIGSSLYLSGMPGTGKTATVLGVIRALRAEATAGDIPTFDFIEINAMRLRHPYDAYTQIYKALTGEQIGHERAGQRLDQMFSGKQPVSPSGRPCVLLVDELDYMVTRKQTVLYNLFDWPSRPSSWLTCIGIANTMNLPEQLLPRIYSRMGMSRVVFKPYTSADIERILLARLDGLGVFEDGAAKMCSKKVATVSGDIRRALQLCRKAVELAREKGAEKVTIGDVQLVSDISNTAIRQALLALPTLDKLVMVALHRRLNMTDAEEVNFEDVSRTFHVLWADNSQSSVLEQRLSQPPSRPQLLAACRRLGAAQLLHVVQSDDVRDPMLGFGDEVGPRELEDVLQTDVV